MKTILHYANSIDYAGTSRTMELFVKYLDKTKYDVHVLYNTEQDNNRLKYVEEILGKDKVHGFYMKDRTLQYYSPKDTNLFEVLNSINIKFDIFHVHRSGYTEFPIVPEIKQYCNKIVETNIFGHSDNVMDLDLSLCISKYILRKKRDKKNSYVVYNPSELPYTTDNLRKELNLKDTNFVFGRIGRAANFSNIALEAFKQLQLDNVYYLIVNPCQTTIDYVNSNNIKNVILYPTIINDIEISKFYNTIDVLAHYRIDGETFGRTIVDSMIHSKPVISHYSKVDNGHIDIIGDAGFIVNNSTEYLQYMNTFINDSNVLNEKSRLANQLSEQYEISNVIQYLEYLYDMLFI